MKRESGASVLIYDGRLIALISNRENDFFESKTINMNNEQNKFYNESKEYYEILSSADYNYFSEYLEYVKSYADKKSLILDVGCGTGQSTRFLNELGYSAIGVDGSQKFIDHANNSYNAIDFVCADIEKLPFEDNYFDAVSSYNTVEHFNNVEKSLAEMIRVVKPSGKIIIHSPNLLSPKLPFNAIIKYGGETFEGKKSIPRLMMMLFKNIILITNKVFIKNYSFIYRTPMLNYDFPDNDATCYLNPVDLKFFFEKNNCPIISYQKIGNLKNKKNILQKLFVILMPSYMGIIRIVAQKNPAVKISLINATRTGDIISPLGLLSIASALVHEKLITKDEIQILDVNLHNVMRQLSNFKPDIIGISCMTISYTDAIKLAKEIKRKLPGVRVIIGGVHISTAPLSLDKVFEFGVIGEGEETFIELVQHFKNHGSLNNFNEIRHMPGLIFFEDDKVVFTGHRPLTEPLDKMPSINWELALSDYFIHRPIIIGGKFFLAKANAIMTSRGCPYQCVFCSTSLFWQKFRMFSPERVVEEIDYLYNHHGIILFYIWDDLFAVSKDRVKRIIDGLKEKNILGKIYFSLQARTNLIDEAMCELFMEMRVFCVGFGFESGNKTMLSYLKKNSTSPEENKEAIVLLDKYDIGIAGSFMIGSPGESYLDMKDTLDFMRWMSTIKNVEKIWYGLTTPYPGTELWQMAVANGSVSDDMDFKKLDILHTRFSNKIPELFFKEAISRENFKKVWHEASEIVSLVEKNYRLRNTEAFVSMDRYEAESSARRFKKFSVAQKILKVIYQPEKVISVMKNLILNKLN